MSTFSLEGKGLKLDKAEDIESHLGELKDDVIKIVLSGNTIGVGAAQRLAKALEGKDKLEDAQLADIFTGRLREEIPAALEALLPVLQKCPNLHTINLCDNAFGPTAAAPLEAFFKAHAPLRHLYLQNNGMGPEAGAKMAAALEANESAKLETLVCGRNRLENGSAAAWVECFKRHAATLKQVRMPQNGIRPEGIARLIKDGLSQCKELEVVDMQDNTFTLKGSLSLASALAKWPRLSELSVADCLLKKRGSLAVAKALLAGHNTAIHTLKMQYNELDATALNTLVDAIDQKLPALQLVELNGNRFSEDDEQVERLREILSERDNGAELDELEDMEEEDSDEEEEEEEDDEDEDEDKDEKNVDDDEEETEAEAPSTASAAGRKLSTSLDDAIERNLAAALGATSLTK
ncbi:Ran GAP Rna1 [Savitreella phatthalungensis]